jgi:F420-0:gamma-glutamyl ligase
MSIIDHAKELADLIKKYNDQDLYERIVTLREEILSLREENLTLKDKVKKLEVAKEIANKLVRDGNCYYMIDDKQHDHPYCLTCWDSDQKLISLIVSQARFGKTIKCGVCSARKK